MFIRICIAIFIIWWTYIVIWRSNTESPQDDLVFTTQWTGPFSCETVSSIPFDECKALTDLYSTTQWMDRNIQTNWLVSSDPCRRHWVTCTDWNVTHLNLSNNALKWNIPASIGFLTQLEGAYLGKNTLTGPIPTSIENLTNLKQLQLARNSLSGPIPQQIAQVWKNTSRVHIFLDTNTFCWTLPESLFEQENIKTFSLGNNNLLLDEDQYDDAGAQRLDSTLSNADTNQISPQEC